ncbi:MAG: hypothetical protein DDT21_01662 [Syntrophomonadaceae bacterium]|nr:hypothetical protein [Bacillota bacterium]
MEQLYLLFQKELLLWRNSYWRTRKQIALTLAVAAPVALVAVFSGRAVLRWFSPIAEAVQGGLTVHALSPLVALLMVWLFMLFFFSAAMLSRERLLLTPDLPFLMATPVNAKIILAQRLIFLTFLSPFGFFEVAVFGLTPLAALGFLTAAPWFYYLLLLPLIYLYRVIPAALGVMLIMLLLRILSPHRLYQALGAGNLLLGGLQFYIIWGGSQAILAAWSARLAALEPVLWVLPPLAATRDLLLSLMGGEISPWPPLLILAGSVILSITLTLTVLGRLYFHNYERLQRAQQRAPKKIRPEQAASGGINRFAKRSLIWFLVLEHWKMAARNREMLQAGIFFIALLPAYLFTVERFAGGSPPWVMLLNVAAVAFCAHLAILLLFIPYSMAVDRLALQRQYWFYKVAPVEGNTFAGSLFLAHCLPSLALALLLIIPVGYFTGFPGGEILPKVGLLALLVISSVALQQLTMLIEAASIDEEATLLTRIAREATILYGPLLMLPLAIAFYYPYISLLSFMHSLPQSVLITFATLLTVTLAITVTWRSLCRMAAAWQAMEIK